MRHRLLGRAIVGALVTATAAIAVADDAKDAAIQKDRNEIKGTWRVVVLVVNGNTAAEEDARKLTVVNGSDGTCRTIAKSLIQGSYEFQGVEGIGAEIIGSGSKRLFGFLGR